MCNFVYHKKFTKKIESASPKKIFLAAPLSIDYYKLDNLPLPLAILISQSTFKLWSIGYVLNNLKSKSSTSSLSFLSYAYHREQVNKLPYIKRYTEVLCSIACTKKIQRAAFKI